MKLLLVVANFVPEIGSAAHIYFDLAKAFVQRGHDVDVITSYPRKFYLDKTDINKNFLLDETISGINVHRCRHNAIRDNIILRGLEHFLIPIYYFRGYQKLSKKFDACLIYIPPLPLYYFARAIKKFHGIPSVLNYQDFHPQELTDVGVLKNGMLIKIMEYIERRSYKNADFITVLSEGGIDYIAKRGGKPLKIKHIYNGCTTPCLKDLKRKDFKSRERIEDKILISYAGILSPFQGLDNILNLAKELGAHDELIFYLVGDGKIKDHLEQKIKDENISNVRLLPLQPKDEYFNIINSSDISLISLDERMNAPCIPGKTMNLMAFGQPLIAIVPEECETNRVIRKANCGICINPNELETFRNTLLYLCDNPQIRKQLGENGKIFVEENMDLKKSVVFYERIFKKLIEKSDSYEENNCFA